MPRPSSTRWAATPNAVERESVEVPLTSGHDANAITMSEIHGNRRGVEALNHLLDNSGNSITA
jgi:hypothetical protein